MSNVPPNDECGGRIDFEFDLEVMKETITREMFYIAPGTATVTYVQTFGADTAQLTDGDIAAPGD